MQLSNNLKKKIPSNKNLKLTSYNEHPVLTLKLYGQSIETRNMKYVNFVQKIVQRGVLWG